MKIIYIILIIIILLLLNAFSRPAKSYETECFTTYDGAQTCADVVKLK